MTPNPHPNGAGQGPEAEATSGQLRNVPVRRPRPVSPRRQAARIAQDIVDRMEEGLDWSWEAFGIEGDEKMIALVKSYLAFDFDMAIDEPAPQAAGGVRMMMPTHTEAPVSANCRLTIEGHEVQVTLRSGATPHEVELVVGTMAGFLCAYAHQPPAVASEMPPPPAQPPAAAPESPPPPAAQQEAGRETETPYCYEHGQAFRRHEKEGQVWYSHMIQNPPAGSPKWCRY